MPADMCLVQSRVQLPASPPPNPWPCLWMRPFGPKMLLELPSLSVNPGLVTSIIQGILTGCQAQCWVLES